MNNIKSFFKKRNTRAVIGLFVGTAIYSMSVVWLLDIGEFYAGGITGFSQLLANLMSRPYLKSLFIATLNIPLFIIGWRGVSRRFATLSLMSVILQVGLIAFLDFLALKGFSPFQSAFFDDSGVLERGSMLTLALLAGLFCGIGQGIALRSGASTGGIDIISQFVSFKKNVPFAAISLTIDSIIIVCSAFVGNLKTAIYTIVRLIISMTVLNQIHTIYNYLKIEIVTTKKEEMRKALIEKFTHGITIYNVTGGYSLEERWVLSTVCSQFEAEEYTHLAQEIDDKVFIMYSEIKQIHGLFFRRVIT